MDLTHLKSSHSSQRSSNFVFNVPGKFILLGEHAVVYGSMGLAYPIKNALMVNCLPLKEKKIIIQGLDENFLNGELYQELLYNLRELLDFHGFYAEIKQLLPHGSGLGGSASLSYALVRCMLISAGISWDPNIHGPMVHALERVFHGTPSGIDDTVVSFNKPVLLNPKPELLNKINGLDIEYLNDRLCLYEGPTPSVLLVNTREKGNTKKAISVAKLHLSTFGGVNLLIKQTNELIVNALISIQNKDWFGLGRLLNMYHEILYELGVSSQTIEDIRKKVSDYNVLGTKLTGAGLGGFVLLLCAPEQIKDVYLKLKRDGYEVIIANNVF